MDKIYRSALLLLSFFLIQTLVIAKSTSWLDGNWIGLKYQVNAYKKWQMTLVLNTEQKLFTVYYPELDCNGTLELVEKNDQEAIFIEKINEGQCMSDGYIIIKKVDNECIAFICYRDNKTRLASYAVLQPDAERYKGKDAWKKLNNKGTKLYAEVFETMRQKSETEYGKHDPKYAFALNNLALFYDNQLEYQKALPLYLETASIYKEVLGEKTEEYILALDNLAGFYRNSSKAGEAEALYIEVLRRRKELLGENHPNYVTSLNNLGFLYLNASNYSKAEPLLLESLRKTKEVYSEQSTEYNDALYNLALLYQYEGNFAEAELYFKKQVEHCIQIWGEGDNHYSMALANLAEFYKSRQDYDKAELLILEAIQLYKKDVGHNKFSIVNSNFTLANIYLYQEKYPKAESLLLEVLNVQKELYGSGSVEYGNTINSLAVVYNGMGNYKKSAALYAESSLIIKKVLGESSASYLVVLQNLASAYSNQNNFTRADSLYKITKQLAENIFGKNHLEYSNVLVNMATYYQKQNRSEEALEIFKEAVNAMLLQVETNFAVLSEKEKALFYKTFSYKFDIFNSFATKQIPKNPTLAGEIYNNQLVTKALLFNATNKMKDRILKSNNESLKTLFNNWLLKKEYLSKVYQLPKSEKIEQNIDEKLLEQEVNTIEKELSKQSEVFGTTNDKKKVTWQDIQKTLKPNEAAVEIVRFDYHNGKSWTDTVVYLALIIKPGTAFPETVVLYDGMNLESKYAKYYSNSIRYRTQDEISYGQYWKSIQDKLTGIKKVYFSPDGVYNQINLLTLKNPTTGKYLIDEIDIQLLNNAKSLLKERSTLLNNGEAVLIGYPDYNGAKEETTGTDRPSASKIQIVSADTSQRFFRGGAITMLPETKKEVENISQIFAKSKLKTLNYTNQEASEILVKSLKNPRIVHIATHGFFMQDVQNSSSDERGLMGMDNKKVVENPLLRSGLLFANAKKAFVEGGDGILTSYEVMNLNLDETDLVIMSACETGLGEIQNGEGVYGLQRAFQTAGVKTILMSLWSVSDAATQELMTMFYENWITKKQTKRLAFKMAQQSLKEKYPESYFWGAFVMVGE